MENQKAKQEGTEGIIPHVSLTKFIEAFFPFNADEVSSSVAKRQGKTKEAVLQEWEAKREAGSRYHDVIEKLINAKTSDDGEALGGVLDGLQEDERFVYDQLLDFLADKCQGWDLWKTEVPVKVKGFSCKVDAVFKNDLGEYMICEWKFGSKLWMKSFEKDPEKKKGLGPFRQFDNCKYSKANAQVVIYKKALEESLEVTVSKMYIVHMNDKIKDTPTVLNPSNLMISTVEGIWGEMDNAATFLKLELEKIEKRNIPREVSSPIPIPGSVVPASPQLAATKRKNASMQCKDVMIDMETLSTENNSHILTLGAIRFVRSQKTQKLTEMDTFYRRISFKSNEDLEMHKSSDTILWWMKQNENVRKEAFGEEGREPLKKVLEDFKKWFSGASYIWGHGSVFAVTILTAAFKRCKVTVPYKFWNIRDTRTIYDIHGIKLSKFKTENTHHALHDCYNQIEALRGAFFD